MKSYEEIARNVFRRRKEYEQKQREREAALRRVTTALSAVMIAVMILFSAGTCYVLATSLNIFDDFLGIFTNRANAPLSDNQEQFIEGAVAEIGERVTCNGYTVTAKGAFTDGTVAYVLLDVIAPEGVNIDDLAVAFHTEAKEIIRGENPDKHLNITGLGITSIPIADNDGKANTTSVLIEISCVRLNGSVYSFADGYARYLELRDLHYYLDEYPYSYTTISDGTWKFEIMFNAVHEGEVELLTAPMRMQIQRMTVTDYVDATISSIRLKGMGVIFYFTIDADDIQEAGDFGEVQIVMKDGSVVNAYPETAARVENGDSGNAVFCCYYITQAPIIFEEVDHVIVGEKESIQMPQDYVVEEGILPVD